MNEGANCAVFFHGVDLEEDAADVLLETLWPFKLRKKESELFASKDWDERARHSVVSQYWFCHLFTVEIQSFIRANIDDTDRSWYPIKSGDPLSPPSKADRHASWKRKIGSLIRARQWCDEHGIPYRIAVRTAVRAIFIRRGYLMGHRTLPDPGLFNNDDIREAMLQAWIDEIDTRIQHGTHPRYVLTNKVQHPDVEQHQQWIIDQIRRRSQPHHACSKFLRLRMITTQNVIDAFGMETLIKAHELSR